MPTRPLYREYAIKDLLEMQSVDPESILEFGYGGGEMLNNFTKWYPEAKVFGYDFSDHAAEFVKRRCTKATILSSEKDCKNRKYKMLCAFEVLEHIESDVEALEEWGGFLEPGGYVLISVPAHMSKWQVNDEVSGHYRRYEKDELFEKFVHAGFQNIRIINYGYPMTLFLDAALKIVAEKEAKFIQGSMEDKTKVSGLRRTTGLKGRIFSIARHLRLLFYPLFALQRIFYNYDLSSGYVAIAQKK